MKAVLGNHTTSLIHDDNDEIDGGIEETNDVIPVNKKNSSKFKFRLCYFKLCCYKQ
jgi:hypothetical protein